MSHFTLADWTDFVRRLKNRSVTAQMQRHLDEGCEQCSRVVRMWQDLCDFGSREGLYRPPERALRSALESYRVLKSRKEESKVAMMARLLFDSYLEPIPAGIRSSQSTPRQLAYSAGNLLIDLRLEHKLGRTRLVGQAQRRVARGPGVAGLDVIVQKGAKIVAQTRCNRFGEFQLELQSKKSERFSVLLKARKSVVTIPLRGVRPCQESGLIS